jgi:hypothetical protein
MISAHIRVYLALCDSVCSALDELGRAARSSDVATRHGQKRLRQRAVHAFALVTSLAGHERALLAGRLPAELRGGQPFPCDLAAPVASRHDAALACGLAGYAEATAAALRARAQLAVRALDGAPAEPALDRLCARLVRQLPPLALLGWLPAVLPALGHEARLGLLAALRLESPPELFAAAYDLAARVLAACDFRQLEHGLGAGSPATAA